MIITETLDANDVYTYTFKADGTQDISATIAWTDPAANPLPGGETKMSLRQVLLMT